jgi:hypothetical protein
LVELWRWFASFRDGLVVDEFRIVHMSYSFLVHLIWQCASCSNCFFSAGDMFWHIAWMV